jgi:hypothetical protein
MKSQGQPKPKSLLKGFHIRKNCIAKQLLCSQTATGNGTYTEGELLHAAAAWPLAVRLYYTPNGW